MIESDVFTRRPKQAGLLKGLVGIALEEGKVAEKRLREVVYPKSDPESSLVRRQMRRLFEVAEKGGNRVILSGDYKQHGAVAAGDSFRLLESEAGVRFAELKSVRRQKDPNYKRAVEEIIKGTANAAKGFDRLDAMGAVVEASGPERHSLLVADYLAAVEDRKSALIIAPTHREGERLPANYAGH